MTTTSEPTGKDFEQMMGFLMGFFQTQIASAIASYSIADHLAKGPATADEIAAWEGIDPQPTFRLLRACASLGLVTYDGNRFTATPLLGTLRSDVPGSLRSLAIAWAAPGHWQPWGRFTSALKTGEPQTFSTLGASAWDYYKQQPAEGAAFTRAMQGLTSGLVNDVVQVLDTSNVKLAADIGGGSGILLHGLLAANPHLKGIVVDLPEVVGSAEIAARELGLSNRSTTLPSSFFEYVPPADLYLLKHVLHDWSDDESLSILSRCRESIRAGGKIAVVEILLGEVGGEPALGPLMDLNMMTLVTGRERTQDEYRRLIEKAGFHVVSVKPIRPPMVVIEATA
ncbi:MAG: methyltransferase [Verrucomicrobia bacterium]|nr:methyltransferase [Verrucomicrobiota bacterium]